ncbi:UDP-N-acetylmuramate dehydrogenase domain protein [Mycobacterium xenopi 4042]|uniref:UDP-N-acetylmuramate dehydrogenase domain protein n=1 Tax=Mycobacterium xenopi 4042 TaxID=1299334 RepID=X8AQF4_MYCXE|nr:UDP-N-acetylmuramate dehydrogenase domain protein [Mycobacterium xenopi 4042]
MIRDQRGNFRVLEDNLRSPSGVSYVMENRRTMARVFPNLFATHRVRAVDDYAAHLLRALRNSAATNEADPTVVVLTPGSPTPRTSSIRCWPGRWVSNLSRAATCSAATTRCICAPPKASARSTSSTAASTTRFWTRCSFVRTRCSGWPACSTPPARATW